jgi:hypothetical protein
LHDEVNEPLGMWPDPKPRPPTNAQWVMLAFVAPAAVAVAMGAFMLGRQDARPSGRELAAVPAAPHAERPPVAVRRDPPPEPQAAAPADPSQAAGAVKTGRTGTGQPLPLIIDVQQALATQRAVQPDVEGPQLSHPTRFPR